jgi:hypothetical protein
MFELGAYLLARGAVGALAAGFVYVLAAFLAIAPWTTGHLSSWWSWTVVDLAIGTAFLGLAFAPLTMILLPLTWIAFRRSRFRFVALVAMGVIGGLTWSLELFAGEIPVGPWVGAVSGLSAASCFLGFPNKGA